MVIKIAIRSSFFQCFARKFFRDTRFLLKATIPGIYRFVGRTHFDATAMKDFEALAYEETHSLEP